MRLQSAIFDMDGTLLDSMGAWTALTVNTLRELGVDVGAGFWEEYLKPMTLRQGAAYCCRIYGLSQTEEELAALMEERMRRFYNQEVQVKAGVPQFLSLLKMEGVGMYVATATDRSLTEAALCHTGIRDYFQGILTSSEVGKGKESPEIYERAMRRLRSTKKDTVIFEDSLHAVRTAKSAGFRVVGVYDPFAGEEDQAEIQRLSDYYIRSFEEMFEVHVER